MPLIRECLRDTSPVIHLQNLNNGFIATVTEDKGVYIFNPETCQIITRMKIEELRPFEHGVTFSPDGRYFCFAHNTSKGNAIRVIDITTKKLLRSYATHDNPIDILSFDPTSTYIAAGTATGRVMVWHTDSTNLIARFASFPEYTPHLFSVPSQNYVSAIAFSPTHIASAGYGGSMVVTNLYTQANTIRIKPAAARINAIVFMDSQHIITGNEHGLIELINLEEHHPIQQLMASIGPIYHLLHLRPSSLLLAASRFNHIALIDLKTMRVIDNRYISLPAPIRSVTLADENKITVGLESGEIVQAELSPCSELKQLLDHRDFDQVYAMGEADPLIKECSEYRQIESIFQRDYNKALQAFSRGDDDDASFLLKPFAAIANKRRTVQGLISAFNRYPRFVHLIKEKKYSAVYGLAEQYPPLKQTEEYRLLEQHWDETFSRAQIQVLTEQTDKAKELVKDFTTIPSKSIYIRLLLHQAPVLLDFSKALHEKDYFTLKRVTDQHPVLKETPSYKAVMTDADRMVDTIIGAIKTNQFDKAKVLTEKLKLVPHLIHHYDHIADFLKKAKRLHGLYTAKSSLQYYELLDKSHELAQLPQAKAMEKVWKHTITKCEKEALVGNTSAIKKILGPLIHLSTRAEKIGNLLRISYQMQIKYYMSKKEYEQTKKAIKHYVTLFGMDNEIRQLIKYLNRSGETFFLDEEQLKHRPRTLWLTLTQGNVPDNIILEE